MTSPNRYWYRESVALRQQVADALAADEPAAPTERQLLQLAAEFWPEGCEPAQATRFARAALARFGHQPAPPAEGEVGELVAKLRRLAPQNPLGTADPTITRAADLLEQRHPAPVPVTEKLPEPSTKVLAHYSNDLGKGRTICAIWVPAKSCSGEGDLDRDGFLEYDEEGDKYYWPEGWYEAIENWDELGWVKVYEGEVVYWQPLPKWPALPLPAGEVES